MKTYVSTLPIIIGLAGVAAIEGVAAASAQPADDIEKLVIQAVIAVATLLIAIFSKKKKS